MMFWLLAMLLGVCTVVVLGAGFTWPIAVVPARAIEGIQPGGGDSSNHRSGEQRNTASPSHDEQDQPNQLRRLASRPLRRPLYDQPAVEGTDARPMPQLPRNPLGLRLVGTIDEPGHAQALFRMKDGRIELCGAGQSVDDAGGPVTVERIDGRRVTVRYAGRSHELILKAPDLPG